MRRRTASGSTRIDTLWNVPTRSVPAVPSASAVRSASAACSWAVSRTAWRSMRSPAVRRHHRPAAAGALEQPRAGRPLERGDLQADGRLRVAELLRGARERARRDDGVEGREVTHLDAEQTMRLFHHETS